MNNISKTLSISATLVLLLAGCSQQQVSGDSSQVAGSSQQVAGSSQQVSPDQVSENCPSCNAPKVEPVAETAKPQVARAGGHTHPANRCTKSIRHNHPNGTRSHSHKYSCKGAQRGNKWTHGHPANRCTKSIRHTHKFNSARHNHSYSCQKKTGINIHALQRKLKAKGYYKGPINGVINTQTRSALKRYQQKRK
ncbi:MAG: peptidoglycan-binding domain-containing protein [Thiotrichaceae bacterium]